MKRAALLALAGLIVIASPVYADIKFVGQSRATSQLKRDVLTAIASYAKARHACDDITAVEAAGLGDTYEPKTPLYRATEPQHLYERWVAELCGTKRAFLVALWPSRPASSGAAPLASALAASPWDGTYFFEQPIGPGSGGLQLFVNHKLTIGPNGCTIAAQGYQTNEQIRCKATPNGDKLDVAFVSHEDGMLVNRHNVKIYEPNQKLFTLTRKGNAVTTEWAGYSMNKTIGAAPGEDTFKKQM